MADQTQGICRVLKRNNNVRTCVCIHASVTTNLDMKTCIHTVVNMYTYIYIYVYIRDSQTSFATKQFFGRKIVWEMPTLDGYLQMWQLYSMYTDMSSQKCVHFTFWCLLRLALIQTEPFAAKVLRVWCC
jgi:hypothetical protein